MIRFILVHLQMQKLFSNVVFIANYKLVHPFRS